MAAPFGVANTLVGSALVLMSFGGGMLLWSRRDELHRTLRAGDAPAREAQCLSMNAATMALKRSGSSK